MYVGLLCSRKHLAARQCTGTCQISSMTHRPCFNDMATIMPSMLGESMFLCDLRQANKTQTGTCLLPGLTSAQHGCRLYTWRTCQHGNPSMPSPAPPSQGRCKLPWQLGASTRCSRTKPRRLTLSWPARMWLCPHLPPAASRCATTSPSWRLWCRIGEPVHSTCSPPRQAVVPVTKAHICCSCLGQGGPYSSVFVVKQHIYVHFDATRQVVNTFHSCVYFL